ncbi:MAG: hypothetical protein H0W25_01300 [Acidimicrobiia bacterium]|nr:hypothetical protein [Acidimicrobiia bacterium]
MVLYVVVAALLGLAVAVGLLAQCVGLLLSRRRRFEQDQLALVSDCLSNAEHLIDLTDRMQHAWAPAFPPSPPVARLIRVRVKARR